MYLTITCIGPLIRLRRDLDRHYSVLVGRRDATSAIWDPENPV